MAKLIWVQAQPNESNLRKVVLSDADLAHPTDNHEVWIVAYEDPRFDADGNEIEANPPVQVADTPGVRKAILAGDLAEVSAPSKAAKASAAEDEPAAKGSTAKDAK
jgi:hypothetical protein